MNKTLKNHKKQLVKDAILDSAKNIVETRGFSALSLRKIADDIGYSVGSIYQYYKNKDEILKDLIEIKYKEMIDKLSGHNNSKNLIEAITGKFMTYCEFALENKDYYKEMMLSNDPNVLRMTGVLNDPPTPGMNMLIQYLRSLDRDPDYSIDDPKQTAKFLWSSIFGLIIKMIIEDVDDFEMVENHIHFLLKALKGA
ncbi:MAG: TetR/AcrR family transcriptional regulator [Candidatus Izemoplasmatales bacterium]